jgi:hypothetical protein
MTTAYEKTSEDSPTSPKKLKPWEVAGVSKIAWLTAPRSEKPWEAAGCGIANWYLHRQQNKIKSRHDLAKDRRATVLEIVEQMHPMIVRQAYYQATVRGICEKTENGYDAVQRDLVLLRRSGEVPLDWIVDNSRTCHRVYTCSSIEAALEDTVQQYRKSLWDDADCEVQIWLEKDSLSGIVEPITNKYDVPLMVVRGYSSISFAYEAAQGMRTDVPVYVYHFCDLDPSGVNASEKIEEALRKYAPDAEIHFVRIAVTPQQVAMWNLPSRPNKSTDSRTKKFAKKHSASIELDAIDPNVLRHLVENAILQHMLPDTYADLMKQEQREKITIRQLIDNIDLNDIEEEDPEVAP